EAIRGHWEQMRTNTLPNNTSLAEQQLLAAVERWSQDSRISVSSIAPQPKQDTEEYSTIECRVEGSGNMNALARFLYDVEKDPLGLKVEVMDITTRDNNGQQLSLGLQLSGLVLIPKDARQVAGNP